MPSARAVVPPPGVWDEVWIPSPMNGGVCQRAKVAAVAGLALLKLSAK
jgi:hypothetical protein